MKWLLGIMLSAMSVMSFGDDAKTAVDKDAQIILEKGIQAIGGQKMQKKIKAAIWKSQGKISSGGIDSEYVSTFTIQGLDHFRATFETQFMGRNLKLVTVLAKDKGWRKVGDKRVKIDMVELTNQKRAAYLQSIPIMLSWLKDNRFKLAASGEKKFGDKTAIGLRVTGPEKKDFTLFFNKGDFLPIALTVQMEGRAKEQFTEETFFSDYKEFSGIRIATKLVVKRNGGRYLESQVTEFKVLDNLDSGTFDEPK